jgi:hypothetical protein
MFVELNRNCEKKGRSNKIIFENRVYRVMSHDMMFNKYKYFITEIV